MITEAREELRHLDALLYALMDDAIAAAEFWHDRADGFSRRTYIRTVFALVEGTSHLLMTSALRFDELRENSALTSGDLDFLVGRSKKTTCDTFKSAVKVHAKARNLELQISFGSQGWEQFRKAVDLRHQITHPKSLETLNITLDDLKVVEEAMDFFRQVTAQFLQK
tara:strand:+ start:587 stop:1087 length:501 start_codon:yes stop_codon:yes gene_type:complete